MGLNNNIYHIVVDVEMLVFVMKDLYEFEWLDGDITMF